MSKKRLDVLLLELGWVDCRNRARAEIMSGRVLVNGEKCDKPGVKVNPDAEIKLLGSLNPYVSRGGLKLAGAYQDLGFSVEGKIVVDVGASTGGFTHFSILHGAEIVYAVDVGYGQLAWSLRQHSRVITMERTNARHLTKDIFTAGIPEVALVDVSFISLKKILPVLSQLSVREIVALVKPQFEAGKEKVGKKGVIRSPQIHREILIDILSFLNTCGYVEKGLTFSPLKGPQGNLEFFFYAEANLQQVPGSASEELEAKVEKVIASALNFWGSTEPGQADEVQN